jgi:hypothetical protein
MTVQALTYLYPRMTAGASIPVGILARPTDSPNLALIRQGFGALR